MNDQGRQSQAPSGTTSGRLDEYILGDNFWELSVYADYWRRIGIEVEEVPIPGPLQRDGQHRATYPGYEASSGAQGDNVLGRLMGAPAAPENRWAGNRCACATPESEALLDEIWACATADAQTWYHRWRPNDLLIWDNRCTMHRRNPFDPASRRVMHRTQIRQ